jgi:transposase
LAKGKYHRWLEPDGLVLLTGWARDGLTDEQIAHNMGIRSKTLYEWKNRFSEISEALKSGKEVVDYQVENALLKAALEGNTTAQIFWLKNRRPDRWREKREERELETKQQTFVAILPDRTEIDNVEAST